MSRKLNLPRQAVAATAIAALTLLSACGGSTGGDESKKLTFANFVPDDTFQGAIVHAWGDEIEEATDGRITFEHYPSGSLVSATDMLPGVAAGRADLGIVIPFYFPAQLPLASVGDAPFLGSNVVAKAASIKSLTETYGPLQEEFEKQKVKPLAVFTSTDMVIGCKKPLSGLDDLEGRTVRAAGTGIQVLESAGAKPISLAAAEIRDGVARGIVDCYSSATLDNADALGLFEVAPYVYTMGMGTYATDLIVMNLDTWNSLSDDDKKAVQAASENLTVTAGELIAEAIQKSCDRAKEAGVEIKSFSDADKKDLASLSTDRVLGEYKKTHEKASEIYTKFKDLVEENNAEYADYADPVAECVASNS